MDLQVNAKKAKAVLQEHVALLQGASNSTGLDNAGLDTGFCDFNAFLGVEASLSIGSFSGTVGVEFSLGCVEGKHRFDITLLLGTDASWDAPWSPPDIEAEASLK